MTAEGPEHPAARRRAHDLASAVHELRTPLATVQGFLETLVERGEGIEPETRAHITAVAHRNAVLLGQRIDALLAYQRLSVTADLDLVGARLRQVVDRVVEDCAGILMDHHVDVDVDPGTWAVLDHDAIAHVLANLLSNAARHSSGGSTITIEAAEAGGRVWVAVTDTGEGIAEHDQPHVFEAFYRGGTQDGDGSGLGLAVVHRYVQLWGGRVELHSTRGQGTAVTFSLEAAPPGGVAQLTVSQTAG